MEMINKLLGILTIITLVSCGIKQKSQLKVEQELSTSQRLLNEEAIVSSSFNTVLVNDSVIKQQRIVIFPKGHFILTEKGYKGEAQKVEIQTFANQVRMEQTFAGTLKQKSQVTLATTTTATKQRMSEQTKSKMNNNIFVAISIILCLSTYIGYRLHKSTP